MVNLEFKQIIFRQILNAYIVSVHLRHLFLSNLQMHQPDMSRKQKLYTFPTKTVYFSRNTNHTKITGNKT